MLLVNFMNYIKFGQREIETAMVVQIKQKKPPHIPILCGLKSATALFALRLYYILS